MHTILCHLGELASMSIFTSRPKHFAECVRAILGAQQRLHRGAGEPGQVADFSVAASCISRAASRAATCSSGPMTEPSGRNWLFAIRSRRLRSFLDTLDAGTLDALAGPLVGASHALLHLD